MDQDDVLYKDAKDVQHVNSRLFISAMITLHKYLFESWVLGRECIKNGAHEDYWQFEIVQIAKLYDCLPSRLRLIVLGPEPLLVHWHPQHPRTQVMADWQTAWYSSVPASRSSIAERLTALELFGWTGAVDKSALLFTRSKNAQVYLEGAVHPHHWGDRTGWCFLILRTLSVWMYVPPLHSSNWAATDQETQAKISGSYIRFHG